MLFVISTAAFDTSTAFADEAQPDDSIVILYTNDVHCGLDDAVGYAGLAAYKKEPEQDGTPVMLVDCGDAVQGGIVSTLSKGEALIDIMNTVGYDAAIPGDHEFDYGMEQCLKLAELADFPYLS